MRMTKYIGVAGFLGAGKTTALKRLAGYYTGKALTVGIVTNDQAENLVDTANLGTGGNPVEEVAGGCFCCEFNSLIDSIRQLKEGSNVDIILAEPVGSCTDVVATVIRPLIDLYSNEVTVAPHSVLVDPHRAMKLMHNDDASFSGNVVYIFEKQLEEADIILLNKVDLINREEKEMLIGYLKDKFPGKRIIGVSAKTGEGYDEWIKMIDSDIEVGKNIADVDYDIYANGEASLGWLNSTISISAENPFDGNSLLMDYLYKLKDTFVQTGSESAHLKLLLKTNNEIGIANLISNSIDPILSSKLSEPVISGQLVINARVEIAPDILKQNIADTLEYLDKKNNLDIRIETMESFSPARPNPVHRYSKSASDSCGCGCC